jgi:hypothetical protein
MGEAIKTGGDGIGEESYLDQHLLALVPNLGHVSLLLLKRLDWFVFIDQRITTIIVAN